MFLAKFVFLMTLATSGVVALPINASRTSGASLRGASRAYGVHEDPEQNIVCTAEGQDLWQTNEYVECCGGTFECLKEASWTYVCVTSCNGCHQCTEPTIPTPSTPAPPPTPPPPPTPAPPPTPSINTKVVVWNVHWENKDVKAMADVLVANNADILGINEFTANMPALVHELNLRATTRSYELQPGAGSFIGYGTDMIFDRHVWEPVEGGKVTVVCDGSRNGDRAANWLVLRHRASLKVFITGGIHLSYCPEGCDHTHECEMGHLYDKFEDMKRRHSAPVLWMGDLNRAMSDRVIVNMLNGRLGSRSIFTTADMSQVEEPTHVSGGPPIDHIVAEEIDFLRLDGGTTGQHTSGQLIAGSDHYPVFASVEFAR